MVENNDKHDVMMDRRKCGHIRRIHDFQNEAQCVKCDCEALEKASDEKRLLFSTEMTKHLSWLLSKESVESYLILTNEFRVKIGRQPLDPDAVRKEWRRIHGYGEGDLGGSVRDEILEELNSLTSLERYLDATNAFRVRCKEEPLDREKVRTRWLDLQGITSETTSPRGTTEQPQEVPETVTS